jgi:hypothetical protein
MDCGMIGPSITDYQILIDADSDPIKNFLMPRDFWSYPNIFEMPQRFESWVFADAIKNS